MRMGNPGGDGGEQRVIPLWFDWFVACVQLYTDLPPNVQSYLPCFTSGEGSSDIWSSTFQPVSRLFGDMLVDDLESCGVANKAISRIFILARKQCNTTVI